MVSDEELTALALAAAVDTPVAADAVPFTPDGPGASPVLLPDWYMPVPSGSRPPLRGWRRVAVFAVIAAFVVINLSGLCSTYGLVELA